MEKHNISEGNKLFRQKMKEQDPKYFEELQKGQSPEYFVVSCSDSRVSPSVITEAPLGEMFVHRNIANQVDIEDESFAASLYYALKHLKVKKIIIKGHTDCGGVKAAWYENDDEELQRWITNVKKGLPHTEKKISIPLNELSRLNVIRQVENLKQHPIYKKYGEGVVIVGYLFHIENGELEKVTPMEVVV